MLWDCRCEVRRQGTRSRRRGSSTRSSGEDERGGDGSLLYDDGVPPLQILARESREGT